MKTLMPWRLILGSALAALATLNSAWAGERQHDLSSEKVLYCVGYAHLDTQWRWDYTTTIDQYLKDTLDQNFDRRLSISEQDPRNVDLVMRARSVGAHAKFAGSGGAVVGVYEDEEMYGRLEAAYAGTDTKVFKPRVVDVE